MPIVFEIDDLHLTGFTPRAIQQVQAALQKYADDIISETNHLEQIRRHSPSDGPDITTVIVKDAQLLLQRGFGTKSTGLGVKIIRICAAVLSLIVGWMFNPDLLKTQGYLLLFIILFAITMGFVMLSVLKE